MAAAKRACNGSCGPLWVVRLYLIKSNLSALERVQDITETRVRAIPGSVVLTDRANIASEHRICRVSVPRIQYSVILEIETISVGKFIVTVYAVPARTNEKIHSWAAGDGISRDAIPVFASGSCGRFEWARRPALPA